MPFLGLPGRMHFAPLELDKHSCDFFINPPGGIGAEWWGLRDVIRGSRIGAAAPGSDFGVEETTAFTMIWVLTDPSFSRGTQRLGGARPHRDDMRRQTSSS